MDGPQGCSLICEAPERAGFWAPSGHAGLVRGCRCNQLQVAPAHAQSHDLLASQACTVHALTTCVRLLITSHINGDILHEFTACAVLLLLPLLHPLQMALVICLVGSFAACSLVFGQQAYQWGVWRWQVRALWWQLFRLTKFTEVQF